MVTCAAAPTAASVARIADTEQSSSVTARAVAEKLLADDSYHIEFHGFLSNHAKHAVVALYGLQGHPETIQKYWDMYTREVPYGCTISPAEPHSGESINEEGMKALLGKKKKYPELVEFFDKELSDLGEQKVLEKHAPVFLPGLVAALTHGIIHLGWALDFGSRRMLVEGLAYMAYTYVSVQPERFEHAALQGTIPTESLIQTAQLAAAQNLPETILKIKDMPKYSVEAGWRPELHGTGFQWHLSKVLEEGHGIFHKLPQWLDMAPVEDALEGMYKAATLLYLVSAGEPEERTMGNFIVLHLITSLWGAEQLLWKLPEGQHRNVLKCFWASMNAIVATSDAGFPPAGTLQATWDKYKATLDSREMLDTSTTGPGSNGAGMTAGSDNLKAEAGVQSWRHIIERVWGEDEEHNIKLVYVCRELWRRYGHWRGFRAAAEAFTPTPGIGPGVTSEFSA